LPPTSTPAIASTWLYRKHLGTLKEAGEFIAADSWYLPCKVHQMSALVTDGQRLYFQAADRDRIALGEVSVSGVNSALIATPFLNTFLDDLGRRRMKIDRCEHPTLWPLPVLATYTQPSPRLFPDSSGSPRSPSRCRAHESRGSWCLAAHLGYLGQAEIQNLGVSALSYEDVSWFYVAVDNALGMGCLERIRNVDAECQQRVVL
jgi:hypothetical protein